MLYSLEAKEIRVALIMYLHDKRGVDPSRVTNVELKVGVDGCVLTDQDPGALGQAHANAFISVK